MYDHNSKLTSEKLEKDNRRKTNGTYRKQLAKC